MKITGIVAEYNPFHNGHEYQIKQSRLLGATHVVCIVSPYFVQRGDIAVFSKWDRTRAALACGADLIVELPTPAALSSSQNFAHAAVKILNHLNIDTINFGSEHGNVDMLTRLATACLASVNHPDFNSYIKQGVSYPTALCNFLSATYPDLDASLLSSPNNVLGVEYIKAILQINPDILVQTIPRTGASHDSLQGVDDFASATYLRKLIIDNDFASCKKYIPHEAYSIFERAFNCHCGTSVTDIEKIMLYKLKFMSTTDFLQVPDVIEGLENRLVSAAKFACSFDEFLSLSVSKRYTLSRIRRIAFCSVLQITPAHYSSCTEYVRVLGSNKKGFEVMANVRKNAYVPISPKFADLYKLFPNTMQIEVNAHNLFSLANTLPLEQKNEWSHNPIILK